jgi:hypothetical protein
VPPWGRAGQSQAPLSCAAPRRHASRVALARTLCPENSCARTSLRVPEPGLKLLVTATTSSAPCNPAKEAMNSALATDPGVPGVATSGAAVENSSVRRAGLAKSSRLHHNFGRGGRLQPVLRSRRRPTSGTFLKPFTAAEGTWCVSASAYGCSMRQVNSELASYRRPGHNPSVERTSSGMACKPAVCHSNHRHTSGLHATPPGSAHLERYTARGRGANATALRGVAAELPHFAWHRRRQLSANILAAHRLGPPLHATRVAPGPAACRANALPCAAVSAPAK